MAKKKLKKQLVKAVYSGPVKVKWIKIVEDGTVKRVFFEGTSLPPVHGHFELNAFNQTFANRLIEALVSDLNIYFNPSTAPLTTEYTFIDTIARPPGTPVPDAISVLPHHIQVDKIRFTP